MSVCVSGGWFVKEMVFGFVGGVRFGGLVKGRPRCGNVCRAEGGNEETGGGGSDSRSWGCFLPEIVSGFSPQTNWEEINGGECFVVRPPEDVPARCVAHFMGGVFAGVAPRLLYRNLIELLAESGLIVVVTPFEISMDYMNIVDQSLDSFEKALATMNDGSVNGLPVVGIGHSLGAVLHVILGSLFPERARSANVLISFNNRSARDAIPSFDVITSVLTSVGPTLLPTDDQMDIFDETTSQVVNLIARAPVLGHELGNNLQDSIDLITQIQPLLAEIASGYDEFTPSPEEVRVAAERGYDVLRTLVIQCKVDTIDQSDLAVQYLSDRTELKKVLIDGNHLTPLVPDPLNPEVVPFGNALAPVRDPLLADIRRMHSSIMDFLDSFLTN